MLELLCQILVLVLVPELFGIETAFISEVLIIDVPLVCDLWPDPGVVLDLGGQHEHTEREVVCVLTLVLNLLVHHLWGHVHLCADEGAHETSTLALKDLSEAKIDDFDFTILGDHYII